MGSRPGGARALRSARVLLSRYPAINPASNGHAALFSACRDGDLAIVQLLLTDARVNPRSHASPAIAAVNGSAHADGVNARNANPWTPLHLAAVHGHADVVKVLLANGAAVSAQGAFAWTPVHWTANEGHHVVVSLLLANGAAVNAQDIYALTPLHFAAKWGHKGVVETLLANHADVNATSSTGATPLGFALEFGRFEVAEVLRQAGAR